MSQIAPLRRLPELDSVRGIASLTVVFLHFHDMWMPDDPSSIPTWGKSALSLLRPLYTGSEAVILFFVLSGLVLSLPYLRGKSQPYSEYLTRRVLRIYGPYLCALALSLIGASIWHGHQYHDEWAASHWADPVNAGLVEQHVAFIGAYDWRQYDFVIWSLIQEMRISIILPFIIAAVGWLGGLPSIACAALLSSAAIQIVAGRQDLSAWYSYGITVHYAACFIVGILVASNLDRISGWWRRTPSWAHWLFAAGSFACYAYEMSVARRTIYPILHGRSIALSTNTILLNWITMIGAVGLIVVALNAPPARRILTQRIPQFLGRISYSLYLTHPIVLHALTFSCGDKVSAWVQFPIYMALSILCAWLFWGAVEATFMRWSRLVGRSALPLTPLAS